MRAYARTGRQKKKASVKASPSPASQMTAVIIP